MAAFQRAPKPVITEGPEKALTNQNILNLLQCSEHDSLINRHANYYEYRALYKEAGVDLDGYYANHAVTANQDVIAKNFVDNKRLSFAASLAETMPLFANQPGRLGPYIRANVIKTSKQDDQGNSFIDLVLELENTWLADKAPRELRDIPAKMTFLVDVTASGESDIFQKKVNALRNIFLLYGEKANVKCYQNKFGDLGIERPKVIVAKQADYIERVGETLGDCVTRLAADSFTINRPDNFNKEYQKYFLEFMTAMGDNARENIEYMKRLERGHPKREALIKEYEKIAAFVEAYKKTPMTREQ